MAKDLYAAGAQIEQLTRTEDVWDACLTALQGEGIGIALYLSSDEDRADVKVLSNVPEIHSGAPPAEDPFLEWCCTNYEINLTGIAFLDEYPYLPESAKAFIRAAAEHGFTAGMAIPMRLAGSTRYGGFNLGTGLDRPSFEADVLPKADRLRFFCLLVHRKLEELGFAQPPSKARPAFRERLLAPASRGLDGLTPREREVIYLQAQGLPRKEVARMCGISPHTVAEYTTKAYRKLGINNRSQAARLVFDN